MKSIVISIPVGYYARNLLRTGIPEKLLAHDSSARIVVTTPAYQDPSFIGEFSNHGRIHTHPLYEVRTTHNLWERMLWKSCIVTMKHRPLFLPLMRFNDLCYQLLTPKRYGSLFKTWKPDLLVTASPGFHSQKDIPLIREAQWNEVKTLCCVFSWDNLTTNGIFPTRPDYLAVWNSMMKEEAVRIHHYDPEKVFIVGPTAFDIYQEKTIYLSREAFCERMQLNPQKKIVTVTTANPVVFDHRYILKLMLRFVEEGLFTYPLQILCRVHPLDKRDLYREFEGSPSIRFDYPGRYSNFIQWDPDRSEMIHLANTLRHSDVVVNIASTITIESAVVDTPVINVGFATVEKKRFEERIFRNHYNQHYHHILDHGGAWNVRSEEEFLEAINTYLKDPSRDREARRRMAEKLCFRLDGQASVRLADLILQLTQQSHQTPIPKVLRDETKAEGKLKEWTIRTQIGYTLKAYAYFPITGIKRMLLGKNETLKDYFRNCWGVLPRVLLHLGRRQPVIWIEAQSMGEVGQIISLCHEVKRILPDHALILSTHDEASLTLARKRLPLSGSFYSPWDIPWVCRRAVRGIRPRLLLYIEHVKSPVLLREARRLGVSTALLSGFFPRGWEENTYLKRPIACRFWEFLDVAFVKGKEDSDHLLSRGMEANRLFIAGDLKFDAASVRVEEDKKKRLQKELALNGEPVFIAGSVHAHEIPFVIQGFLVARRRLDSLRLIIAPRWIQDAAAMESVLAGYPVSVRRRSSLSSEGNLWKDVLILDTYGELASLYSLASVVFMGGSLPEKNRAWAGLCHNIIEPLLHEKPIFFGTNTVYRKKIVEQLKEVWPRLEVTTPEQLGNGIAELVQDPKLLKAVEERERKIVASQSEVVSRYLSVVKGLLTGKVPLDLFTSEEKRAPLPSQELERVF